MTIFPTLRTAAIRTPVPSRWIAVSRCYSSLHEPLLNTDPLKKTTAAVDPRDYGYRVVTSMKRYYSGGALNEMTTETGSDAAAAALDHHSFIDPSSSEYAFIMSSPGVVSAQECADRSSTTQGSTGQDVPIGMSSTIVIDDGVVLDGSFLTGFEEPEISF